MKTQRLDKYLLKTRGLLKGRLKGRLSRAQWQRLIKSGVVLVNGKAVAPHYIVKPQDKIKIEAQSPKKPAKAKKIILPKIPIIEETPDYAVINKPAGLLIQETGNKKEPTLVDWVLSKFPQNALIQDPRESLARFGIAHRLDRDTSGVMVIAKNQKMFNHLRVQFKNRAVKKTYVALVHGVLTKEQGVIDFPIGRSEDGRMAARPVGIKSLISENQQGREAKTEFSVLKKFLHYTLVEAKPVTGRTHQIRVHFYALGHPIAGDAIYKFKASMEQRKVGKNEPKAPRLMLFAKTLCFNDLRDEKNCYSARIPKTMNDFIKNCKI